jgi:ABC-type oligopeptide transport system substrate-binding subunit
MSHAQMTIKTRGVQGAPKLANEFFTNLPRVLGQRPLEEYASNVADTMQQDAPVMTGYLRNNIQSYRIDPFTMSVASWAPYAAIADERSSRPGYFSNNTFNSRQIGAQLMMDASVQYLRTLLNKYQNGP